ncbi:MAG: hypothetical protein LUI12_05095 [Clostridiales bacterium]|nr:hypothetical protein [Clostridiales bacterium]
MEENKNNALSYLNSIGFHIYALQKDFDNLYKLLQQPPKNQTKKDYKRLTERDEFGNANVIGVDSADLQLNLTFEEFNKVTGALNRLAEFEDRETEETNG